MSNEKESKVVDLDMFWVHVNSIINRLQKLETKDMHFITQEALEAFLKNNVDLMGRIWLLEQQNSLTCKYCEWEEKYLKNQCEIEDVVEFNHSKNCKNKCMGCHIEHKAAITKKEIYFRPKHSCDLYKENKPKVGEIWKTDDGNNFLIKEIKFGYCIGEVIDIRFCWFRSPSLEASKRFGNKRFGNPIFRENELVEKIC